MDGAFLEDPTWPIYAERFQPVGTTCGWYVWSGENDGRADFYVSVHPEHLTTWAPEIVPYLFLPPGWCVVVAPGYEDVWFDPARDVE